MGILAGRGEFDNIPQMTARRPALLMLCGALIGCTSAGSTDGGFAPANAPLGYPVFVGFHNNDCTYQVQDMIMSREKELKDWLAGLPDKAWQVDIVLTDASATKCLKSAERIAMRAGFSNVLVRSSGSLNYASGGPPL